MSEKIPETPSVKIEQEKQKTLDKLFSNLKQGESPYESIINDLFEAGERRRVAVRASSEYSESIYDWVHGDGVYGYFQSEEDRKRIHEYLEKKLKGNILVDLGGGHPWPFP